MTDNNLIEVKDLVKHFPVPGKHKSIVHAVDGVSFSIKKGETLGLVGESGCGKSTIAKSIVRMHKPTSGSIFFESRDISLLNDKELQPYRKRMQMIFQDPYSSLNPRMTVLKLVAEPLIAQGVVSRAKQAREMIIEVLDKVGLSAEHTSRYPHEFSGGQRQRISLARALILKPDFIVCDEPISALDVSIQAQVINLLQLFKQEQSLTYLFIAHDLSVVRYVSDQVGVMYLGKMMEICDSEQIYKTPLHPYTRGLHAAIPIPNPNAVKNKSKSAIEGDIPSPISLPKGCRFHTRCSECMKICRELEPELQDVGNSHFVACHLYTKP